ncbi:ii dna helicase [Moniliophthora roreri MCA 2997]|uniref:Ii dna helicase n=1 Tax=Moniliophthora roreri (strain MCA 2997) TaxID=1381753 RepID=V2XIB2_MONRO|nr:ii dna helicase [Moniliophthora roreri MCA 2997]
MIKTNSDITIIIIPLKRLQYSMKNDILNNYGLQAVIINQDMPWNRKWWNQNLHHITMKQSETAEIVIVTVEQFFRQKGKQMLIQFGELMEERQFMSRILLVVVDKGHMVSTAGILHFRYQKAFCKAYGNLKIIQIQL